MKKLLVLTLVLGLTSAASAAVSWDAISQDVAMGETITITISSDNTAPYGGFVSMQDAAAAAIGDLVVFPGAGDAGGWTTPDLVGAPGYWMHEAKTFNAQNPDIVAGEQFSFSYTALDDSSLVMVDLLDFGAAELARVQIQNTPEPMTLGLLGLGGLFLRRRS